MKNTIYQIAEVVGMDPSTVSMALRDSPRVAEKTKIKIKAVAKELNYIPSSIAQSLATNKTQTLGVVANADIGSPFLSKVFNGIQDSVYKHGYSVLFYSTSQLREEEVNPIQMFLTKKVDGLMIFPSPKNTGDIQYLIASKIPFVLFNRHFLDSQFDSQADYVVSDHNKGAYEITNYLIKLGHSRIAYIGFSSTSSTAWERLNGYKKAFLENGISVKEELIFLLADINRDFSQNVSTLLALKEKPTAIFVVDDEEAMKVIKILKEKGIRIPEDIAVVGYDNIDFGELCDPPLTTMDQFGYEMGMKTAELLLDKIAGKYKEPQHIVLEPKLIIRKSCGAYLKSNQ